MEAFNRLQSTRKSAHTYLVRPKGTQYWQQTLHSANTNTKQTWRYDDKLLDNTILNSSPQLTCSLITSLKLSRRLELFKTFNNYNLLVQPLILSCVCCLECHKCLHCCHYLLQTINAAPTHSPGDPLPMWLLKESIEILATFLRTIFFHLIIKW